MTAKQPIWSGSMRTASMLLLFITIPPFFMTDASASNFVTNLGAILLTLGFCQSSRFHQPLDDGEFGIELGC